jgi:hypothetical protein
MGPVTRTPRTIISASTITTVTRTPRTIISPSTITRVTRTPRTIITPSTITPVTRTPPPITIVSIGVGVIPIRIRVGVVTIRIRVGVGVVVIRIGVISWGRCSNYRGSDDRREERPPGAQNDPSRSCAGCQDKDQQ